MVWASLLEKYRRAVVASRILAVRGRVQRSAEGVVHIIAEHLENRSALISEIADAEPARGAPPRHPRAQRLVAALPGSRDFH